MDYDPFNAQFRDQTEEISSAAVSHVFRTFQGWLALTEQGPSDGTLQLIPIIKSMANVGFLNILSGMESLPTKDTVTAVIGTISVSIPMAGHVDIARETGRLLGELEETTKALRNLNGRLQDTQFLSKAPEEVIAREKDRQSTLRDRESRLRELISQLSG